VRFCLLLLAGLYLLAGGGTALALAAHAARGFGSPGLYARLIRDALYDSSIGVLCVTALVGASLRWRHARPLTVIAAFAAGARALRALATALLVGFHSYHLIEPLVILPCVAVVIWQLTRMHNA
jgi:hypothetical protein